MVVTFMLNRSLVTLCLLLLLAAAAFGQGGMQPGPGTVYAVSGGGGGVTWVHGSEFTSTGNDITRQAGGSYGGWANTDTGSAIDASGGVETKFEFYILDNANYISTVYLAPASGSPYSADPTASTAPVYIEFGSGSTFLTVYEWNGSSYAYNTDVGSFDETDKIWFGFDSTNHIKIWINETPIYTASGTQSGDYVLLFASSDEVIYQGIQNVVAFP